MNNNKLFIQVHMVHIAHTARIQFSLASIKYSISLPFVYYSEYGLQTFPMFLVIRW